MIPGPGVRASILLVCLLPACDDGASSERSSEDAEVRDAAFPTVDCEAPWAQVGAGCEPPALRDDCPPGAFALPDGTCTPVWECPEGWSRLTGGLGCAPPPRREDCPDGASPLPDGTCTPVWPCPERWSRVSGDVACEAPPLRADCPEGASPLPDGSCSPVWPCPAGWRRRDGSDGPGCEPGHGECAEDELPSADGACYDLAHEACGEREWPAGTRFVAAGADPGVADGSAQRPFPTLAAAQEGAADGATIALAPGAYAESVVLPAGVTVAGACAETVILEGSVTVRGEGVTLRDLTVMAGRANHALEVRSGSVVAERLRLRGGRVSGLRVRRAEATVSGTVIGPTSGAGLEVLERGRLSLRRSVVRGVTGIGVSTLGADASAELEGVAVLGVAANRGIDDGYGLGVGDGGSMRVDDAWIDGTAQVAVIAKAGSFTGSRLSVTRAGAVGDRSSAFRAVEGSLALTDTFVTEAASGLLAEGAEARVQVRRVVVHRVDGPGLVVQGGGRLDASEDVVVVAAREMGVASVFGGLVDLSRVWILGTRALPTTAGGVGAVIDGEGARLVLQNASVVGSAAQGVHAQAQAQLTLRDVRLVGNHDAGLAVIDGADGQVDRLVVRDTVASSHGPSRWGVLVDTGNRVWIRDAEITGNVGVGIGVVSAEVRAQRVLVRDTREEPLDGARGIGVAVRAGRLILEDASIIDNKAVGVAALGAGRQDGAPDIEATRLSVRRTQVQASDGEFGFGLFLDEQSRVSLSDSTFSGDEHTSIYLSEGAKSLEADRLTLEAVEGAGGEWFPAGAGLFAYAGVVTLRDSTIRHMPNLGAYIEASELVAERFASIDNEWGVALSAGGRAQVDHGLVTGGFMGLGAVLAGSLTAEHVAVVDADGVSRHGRNAGRVGLGIQANSGGSLRLTDVLVARRRYNGVFAIGGTLDATRLVVQEVSPGPGQPSSFGVGVTEGGVASLDDSWLHANRGEALHGRSAGLTVRRGRVEGTSVDDIGTADGVALFDGATFDATDLLVRGNLGTGIFAAPATGRIVRAVISDNFDGIVEQHESLLDRQQVVFRDNERNDHFCDPCRQPPAAPTASPLPLLP